MSACAHLEEEDICSIDGCSTPPWASCGPPRDRGCLSRIVKHNGANPGTGRQPRLRIGAQPPHAGFMKNLIQTKPPKASSFPTYRTQRTPLVTNVSSPSVTDER